MASTSIVPSGILTQGNNYNITCSADAIGFADPTHITISCVQLKYRPYGTDLPVVVMLYSYLNLLEEDFVSYPPMGGAIPTDKINWQAIYPTKDQLNIEDRYIETRNAIILKLQINQAGCQDSGEFYCELEAVQNPHEPEVGNVTKTESELFNVAGCDEDDGQDKGDLCPECDEEGGQDKGDLCPGCDEEGGLDKGDSKKAGSSASSSNDDLIIGVIGGLVAGLAVAVLLYAVWWRKRTPNDNNS